MTTRQKALAIATMEVKLGHYRPKLWREAEIEAKQTGDDVSLCYVNLRVGQLRFECDDQKPSESGPSALIKDISFEEIAQGLRQRALKSAGEFCLLLGVVACTVVFVMRGVG